MLFDIDADANALFTIYYLVKRFWIWRRVGFCGRSGFAEVRRERRWFGNDNDGKGLTICYDIMKYSNMNFDLYIYKMVILFFLKVRSRKD